MSDTQTLQQLILDNIYNGAVVVQYSKVMTHERDESSDDESVPHLSINIKLFLNSNIYMKTLIQNGSI